MNEAVVKKDTVNEICQKLAGQAERIRNTSFYDGVQIKTCIIILLVSVPAFVYLPGLLGNPLQSSFPMAAKIAIGITFLITAFILLKSIYTSARERSYSLSLLRDQLKEEVVKSFNAGYIYNSNPAFPRQVYESCDLFPSARFDHAEAEDEICGTHNEIPFRLVQIHTKVTRKNADHWITGFNSHVNPVLGKEELILRGIRAALGVLKSLGKNRRTRCEEEIIDLYQGLVFASQFNRTINGVTLVKTDHIESRIGHLARGVQRMRNNVESAVSQGIFEFIELENPEFEKYFSVQSTDPIEARYILSADMMERMVELRQTMGKGVEFCFQDFRLIVAISRKDDFLDKSFDLEKIRHSVYRMRKEITSLVKIVETLRLDRHKHPGNEPLLRRAS